MAAPPSSSVRSWWSRPRWWVAGALVLYLAICSVLVVRARTAAADGADELSLAREEVDIGDVLDGSASTRLLAARTDFSRANGLFRNPVLLPLRPLPIIGRQLRSSVSLTDAGVDVLDVGVVAVDEIRDLVDDAAPQGTERIALLRDLEIVTADVRAALADVDLGPASGLIAPLADARNELAGQLADVDQLAADGQVATAGLADILEGPSSYLVLAANNAEMRSGSGMFLSAGVATFVDGEIEISDFEGTGDLTLDEGVGLPPELEKLYGWADPDQEWRSLGLSPRFPVNAEVASRMWTALGRLPVDGVLSVDVSALALILRVTGPVELADGGTIDADNVLPTLLHDQYAVIQERDDLNDENVARQEQLSTVAGAVIEALEDPGLDVADLAETLRAAGSTRHLFAWSADESQQAVWDALGVDGDLGPESLLVGVANRGGNKLDQYLDVSSRLELVERSGDELRMALTVSVTNNAPVDDLPYVIGFDPPDGLGPAGYGGFVTVSLPAGARELVAPGATAVASGPDGPTTHVGLDLMVASGETVDTRLEFVLDESRRIVRIEPDARIPAMAWSVPSGESWDDSIGHTVDVSETP